MSDESLVIGNKTIGYDEMVSYHIAAKITGLAPRTMQDLGVHRKIPVYQVSKRKNVFLVRDLVEYMSAKKTC